MTVSLQSSVAPNAQKRHFSLHGVHGKQLKGKNYRRYLGIECIYFTHFNVMIHVNKKVHCPYLISSPEIWSTSGGRVLAWTE